MNKAPHNQLTGQSWALWFAALVVAASALGCPQHNEEGQPADIQPDSAHLDGQCSADSECPGDEICKEGICAMTPPLSSLHYGLTINPPNSKNIPPQTIDSDEHSVTDATFVVEPIEPRSGELLTSDGEPAPDGRLRVVADGAAAPKEIQRPVRNGEFELSVLPGDYIVTYVVDDKRWPRIPIQDLDLSDTGASLDLEIPQFEELQSVTGELTRQAIELIDPLAEPVEGAEVVARGATTGYRSPVAMTDEDGHFELRLPPGENDFDVLVSASSENPLVPHASFSEVIDTDTDDIAISVGELDLETLSVSIDLSTADGDQESPQWDDYRVTFRRSVDVGELLVSPDIRDDGTVDTQLPLGTYEVEVIAPPGAPYGSTTDEVSLLDSATGAEIELPQRQRIDGVVTEPGGEPAEGTRISLESIDGSQRRPPPMRTDASGQFQFWLDPGDYRAIVRPRTSSALAISRHDFTVSEEDDQSVVDLQIPQGFVATGRLQTPAGEPIAHTSLRAFEDAHDDAVIAESDTGLDGLFRFVFPLDLF